MIFVILCANISNNSFVLKNVGTLFFVVVAHLYSHTFSLDFHNVFKSKGLEVESFGGHFNVFGQSFAYRVVQK